jgi:hypothetical protein
MAQVQFTVNELVARDEGLADRIEKEIRAAAASFAPADSVLNCRILVETAVDPATSRVRIQFERPGWVKSFGMSLQSPVGDVRRRARNVLREPRPEEEP